MTTPDLLRAATAKMPASGSSLRMETPTAAVPISAPPDRKSTRLNSSHGYISYAVFCLKKKKTTKKKYKKQPQKIKQTTKKNTKIALLANNRIHINTEISNYEITNYIHES